MHSQLAALIGQLNSVTARAAELAAGVDDVTFCARPPSGGWSAAGCFAHLNLTTEAFLPLFDSALRRGRPGFGDAQRYRRGLVAALLEWSLEPPSRLRLRTAPAFVPTNHGTKSSILDDFKRLQGELGRRIESASGLNLSDLRIVSPFTARMSYNVYAALCILLAHERRHALQAERALTAKR